MTLLDLVTYLAAYSTPSLGLTAATNLFHTEMPDSPDLCVCLYEYASGAPEVEVGGSILIIEYPFVQVKVRGARQDPETPYNMLRAIVGAFVKVQDGVLSGKKYQSIMPIQSPYFMQKDGNLRYEYCCNFRIMKDW